MPSVILEEGRMSKFDELVAKLESEGKSSVEAKALAAYIGRKKMGKAAFNAKAQAGRKKAEKAKGK